MNIKKQSFRACRTFHFQDEEKRKLALFGGKPIFVSLSKNGQKDLNVGEVTVALPFLNVARYVKVYSGKENCKHVNAI